MNDTPFDTFVLYYTAWQEDELSFKEMKEYIFTDIGEYGLYAALAVFREKRLEREAQGIKKTLFEYNKTVPK